ncbi:hypothetical protein QUF80_01405 [Desulfococcaceae bacterium HSG8]|nr:hypothetical protein [Desulfococcaceae bacterium HSG8]
MSSLAQDQVISDWKFTEIWTDSTASPPYVLMLLCDRSGVYHIIDPAESYERAVFSGTSYEEVRLWLIEDEYEKTEGRLFAESDEDEGMLLFTYSAKPDREKTVSAL